MTSPARSLARSARVACAAIALVFTSAAQAAEVPVADTPALLSAIASAQAGDELVLAEGVYAIGQKVSCAADGTSDAPIVVRAATPGAAVIELDTLEGFAVSGAHWHFEGLVIRGVCASDSSCEHAFHVVGAADGFVLRDSTVTDFHAQLKVNATDVGGAPRAPDGGLVERCDVGDTRARQTDAPVTKLNIDGGVGWVVRDSFLHDFHKDGGNGVSYGAFMKSGGEEGLFERNLVICDDGASVGGVRIGLSFGGGGTAPEYCAPAYDAGVPCDPEHVGGTLRNNVIVGCSDVGIYLNAAADTEVLYNTLIATSGMDFRYPSSTGHADGNVVSGPIRARDGGTFTVGTNLLDVPQASFDDWYAAPLTGDLTLLAEPAALAGLGAATVTDDFCGRPRPGSGLTLGALEHSLGDCEDAPTGGSGGASSGGASSAGGAVGSTGGSTDDAGGSASDSGGSAMTGGADASGGLPSGTGASPGHNTGGATGTSDTAADADDGGCGCRLARPRSSSPLTLPLAASLLALVCARRRRG